jgi:hypothetical protein
MTSTRAAVHVQKCVRDFILAPLFHAVVAIRASRHDFPLQNSQNRNTIAPPAPCVALVGDCSLAGLQCGQLHGHAKR